MRGIEKKIKSEFTRHLTRRGQGAGFLGPFKHYGRAGLDIIFPPQPLWIGRHRIGEDVGFGSGLGAITLIDDPQCAVCGFPFPYDLGEQALCGNCIARRPVFDRARAAFIYNAHSRGPILSLKHGGQTHGLPVFARQLARAGRGLFDGADRLMPVPLHPRRLRQRRFNQAALLARALSRMKNLPLDTASLQRVKPTDSQGGKTFAGRRRNMQGAFRIMEGRGADIKNRNIILVDDVFTTGATAESCTRALKAAGAARVDVLTLARVVREESADAHWGDADTIM